MCLVITLDVRFQRLSAHLKVVFPIKRLRVVVGQLEFVKWTWSFIGQCNDRGSVRAKLQYLTQVPYTCVTSNAGVILIRGLKGCDKKLP